MLSRAAADLGSGTRLYYVWIHQAYHDITAKYKRTILGSFWISGSMVVTSVSLAVLFGELFHQPLQDSLPYVMSGMLAYNLAGYILFDGTEVYMGAANIIKNHAYPYTFYTYHTVAKNFFMFLHNIIIYWVVVALIRALQVPHWTIIPGLLVMLVFMFTWGSLTGMLASRFRDMRFLLPYIGQLLSFLTPIFWRTNGLRPGLLLTVVNLNPVYNMIELIRQPLLGRAADPARWQFALGYTTLGVIAWIFFFSAYRRRIPFWV